MVFYTKEFSQLSFNLVKNRKMFFATTNSQKTFLRSARITSELIGLCFKVYNGKEFISLPIFAEMVGFKFGEFVSTRCRYEYKKKKKRTKKK